MHNQPTIFQWVLPNACSRLLSVFMIGLIMLLTNANYFIYPSVADTAVVELTESDPAPGMPTTGSPAGPDEKSPNAPVSFNEEYVHKQEDLHNPFWTNHMFQYMIQQSEKLDVVHFEILSPPPEFLG